MLLKYTFFAFVLANFVDSAKILAIFWTPSKSHHLAGVPLLQALAKKGHEVHLLSSFNDKVEIPTYKQELLTGMATVAVPPPTSMIFKILGFYEDRTRAAEKFWENDAVKKIIKNKPKYDVVICLAFFSDHIAALAHHLDAPLIFFSSAAANSITNKFVANPNLPYNSHLFSDTSVDTFLGRLSFVTMNSLMAAAEKYFLIAFQEKLKNKHLPDTPPIWELHKNVSLVLVNSHYSMEQPRPYVPNMVQIGGCNTAELKKLPEKLQKFLDSATNGAIIFSMGTNVRIGVEFSDKIEILMDVFRGLAPVKILLKSEIKIPSTPNNVMVIDWLPQNDVLAHPNVKLFISHAGFGGATEAIYHGVPMLGIPFFADQGANVGFAVQTGTALRLDIQDLTKETFQRKIRELLTNPIYAKNAKKRSSLFRNQPIKPMDNAIWWVEHIIEHKGGEHLRNMGVHLEWYQLYMVDIVLFYLVLIVITITVSFCTTKWVVKKICSKFVGCSKKNTKQTKKIKKQ